LIAADTSTLIAYLSGESGQDVDLLDRALQDHQVCLAPVVLTELLSDPKLPAHVVRIIRQLPLLEIQNGYWQRAGLLRASALARKRKARLADTLVAQSCLDHKTALITRDADFRNLARVSDLKLVP
jgi:predicted nucleic acid-binding protein